MIGAERLGLGMMMLLFAAPLSAQTVAPAATKPAAKQDVNTREQELAAIRQTSVDFAKAFNRGNAKQVAAHWTPDGEYVSEEGEVYSGRPEIEKAYADFFAANKGQQMKVVIDSLRLLSDTAAIEDGRVVLDPPSPGAPAISKYTAVHVKVDGKWLMSTVRDSRVETPSAYPHMAKLEWMIGEWSAEEHGAKTESVCRWVANKSFIERVYTVTHVDYSTSSGVQLIGFNAQAGHIQSWNYSSDGGLAVGIWSPRENGWAVSLQGITGSGISTSAVNLITKLDANAYAWQSVERMAAGEPLPDTHEVILKRQSK